MRWILADVLTLRQYVSLFKQGISLDNTPRCPHCGKSGLWFHGNYARKADRSDQGGGSLNPILIQRFFCRSCKRTCSALPECIPPRRWYLWEVQQLALSLYLAGKSVYAVAKEVVPSRHTIQRWILRFKEQLRLHKDALCHHIIELGRPQDFTEFWQACLSKLSLGKAMRLCQGAGVAIP